MSAELFFDAPDVQSLAGHDAATVGLAQPAARGLLRFLTCGSVDDGKSTLIGRLLYDANSLFDDQLSTLQRDSRQYGTAGDTLDFALLVDGLQAEREQGITIDVAYRFFATHKRKFIVADTPGHVQYTRNMVSGASTADLAIVLVDARKGLLEQTRRHSFLASLLGIRHIVLAVNKIDLVGYDAAIFNKIVEDYTEFAKDLNFSSVQPIPLSARFGDNLRETSEHTPWYQGPSLLNYLEDIPLDNDLSDADFRFPVQYVNRPHAEFRGFAGTVASGHIAVGDEVVITRSGVTSKISQIVTGNGETAIARSGEAVTLVLSDECDISRGDLLVTPKARPQLSDRLVAKLVWFSQEPMQIGKQYLLRSQTGLANVTIGTLNHRIDMEDFSHEAAQQLLINQIGQVTIHSSVPLAFDAYQDNQATGSFILIDRQSNATVAAGMIDAALRKASNIHVSASKITPVERAEQKYQTPVLLWMTGLSGSGKSTLAALVEQKLHQADKHCFILDGDNLRHGLNADLGFSAQERSENIRRVAEVARLMLDAGLIVIVAAISPIQADRDLARERAGEHRFIEIFVDTPLETCMERDPKGLYAKAQAGEVRNFTGIHMAYQPPVKPDLHLQGGGHDPQALAEQIERFLNQQGIIQTFVSEGWSI